MRGRGRIERPAFPAPSEFQMRFMASKTRAATGGEIAEVWLETVWLFDIVWRGGALRRLEP
jgi:hypothetical protein